MASVHSTDFNFMESRFISFYQVRPKRLTFLFVLLVLFIRIGERFLYPGLWAEDGFLFLHDAVMQGPSSFLQSYAGYFHTIPRIIAYLTFLIFPVVSYPYIIMITCTCIYAYVISRFAGDEFSGLISSPLIRFFISVSLCLVPGLYEVLGNLANLHWILFLYLCLVSVRNLESYYNYWEFVFVFFICASTGEPIVLLPVLALRFFYSLKTKNRQIIIYNSVILLLVFSFAVLNFTRKNEQPPGKPSSPEEIVLAAGFIWNQFLMFQPILGDRNVAKFYDGFRTVYRYSGLLLGVIFLIRTFKKKYYIDNFVLPVILSVFLVPILTWIVRPGSLLSYINVYGIWDARYSFILSPWGLLLWILVLNQIPNEKWKRGILYFFFLAYILNAGYRFQLKPYGKTINWFAEYKPAESALKTGCPNKVRIPIHPVLINPILGTENRFYFNFELKNDKICE